MAGRRKNGGIIGPRRLPTSAWSGGNSTGVWDLSAQSLAVAAGLWPTVPVYEFRMVGAGGGSGQGWNGGYYGRGGGAGYTIFVTTFAGPFYVVVGKGGAPGSGNNDGAAGTLNQGGGGAGGGNGYGSTSYGAAAGGGFSGIFSASTINQANALAMAGGGGGGGGDGNNGTTGGYGGGTSGSDGTVHTPGSGLGGSQSAGGSNGGAAMTGGDATSGAYTYGKGGGGGGYYGGGGAMSDGVTPGNGYGYSGGGGSGFLLSSGSDYVSGSMTNGVSVASGNFQKSGATDIDAAFGNYGRGSNGIASAGQDGRVMWRVSTDGGTSFGAFTELSMTGAVQTVTP